MKIIKINKCKIFYIKTSSLVYCTKASKYFDYTQFNSDKFHPHASKDRGVFKEHPEGLIRLNNKNWDQIGIRFTELPEYKSIIDHYTGKLNWKNSDFALRMSDYVARIKIVRGFSNPKKLLADREKKIDMLLESISKNGVRPQGSLNNVKKFNDNISINLGARSKIYFNNRGHHRLSVAKILKIKFIPVKITVSKNTKVLKKFILDSEKN